MIGRRRTTLITIIVLIGMIFAGSFWRIKFTSLPAQLVANQTEILWKSPVDGPGHPVHHASAEFVLTNPGNEIVKILSVETGCGCTKPTLSSQSIEPGSTATLNVEATPFSIGDRRVPITIRTDSEKTPYVRLEIRLIGNRTPPFLLDVRGELSFMNESLKNFVSNRISRQIVVRMIEQESETREPILRCTLPDIQFDKKSVETKPYISEGIVSRTYQYDVFFAKLPDDRRPSGTVSIIDPWDSSHTESLNLQAEMKTKIRVSPASLDLTCLGEGEATAIGQFVVFRDDSVNSGQEPFLVEAESPLIVEPESGSSTGRLNVYRVTAKLPLGELASTKRITLKSSSEPEESVTVSVKIQRSNL